MPTRNINLSREARKHVFQHQIVLATATLQPKSFVDRECGIRIRSIFAVHNLDNDNATAQPIEVGTVADPDHYASLTITDKVPGSVEVAALLNPTHVIPAGTALVIRRANTTAGANTAVVDVHVVYERIDKNPTQG
jgi:hypothetical protein